MSLFSGLDTPRWLSNEETWNKPQKESLGDIFLSSFSQSLQAKKSASGDTSPAPAWLAPWTDEGQQLKLQDMKLGVQSKGMEVARQHNMLDYQTQSKAGEVALSGILAKLAKTGSWNDPQARSDIFDVATKYPALMDTPVWQHTQDNFQKSDKAAADAERYSSQAETANERAAMTQERIDLERSKAESSQRQNQERLDLSEKRFAQSITPPGTEPKEKVLDDGTKLVWMPGAKTLHVVKEGQSKEMSPSQLQSIAKDLESKDSQDPAAKEIRSFLTDKAVKQVAKPESDPASKQAVGGYKIGTVYKGGLKYLGGDPNDQNNWEKVQ